MSGIDGCEKVEKGVVWEGSCGGRMPLSLCSRISRVAEAATVLRWVGLNCGMSFVTNGLDWVAGMTLGEGRRLGGMADALVECLRGPP